jgi:hypothetical protein
MDLRHSTTLLGVQMKDLEMRQTFATKGFIHPKMGSGSGQNQNPFTRNWVTTQVQMTLPCLF